MSRFRTIRTLIAPVLASALAASALVAPTLAAPALAAPLVGGQTGHAPSARSSNETVIGRPTDDDADTRTEQVTIAAGELAGQDGRDRVMRRIERAVRRVCQIDDTGNLSERAAYETCHDASLAGARAQMDVLLARNAVGSVQVADAR